MGDFASTPKTKYGNEYRYRLNWYLACVGTLKSQWCNMWNEHATITFLLSATGDLGALIGSSDKFCWSL